ncbi:MAG: hypothetical protein OHK0012_21330 [Synechococcales cyanobacterium]
MRLVLVAIWSLMLFWGVMSPPVMALALKPGNSATLDLTLPLPPEEVAALTQEAFQAWGRGELHKTRLADEANGQHWIVKGLSRTKTFKFVDDIEVDISAVPGDPQQSRVHLVSVGRQGEFDFGGNRRNLNELVDTINTLRITEAP